MISDMAGDLAVRRLRLRYPATCARCRLSLSAKTEAFWDSTEKKALCLACGGGLEVSTASAGVAGASAEQVHQRAVGRRVAQAQRQWGDHAAAVAAKLAAQEPGAAAWAKGSDGERRLAAFLERELDGLPVVFLHDRRIPGTSANIDHLIVAPGGIWIVDTKNYEGRLERRDVGPMWRADYRVIVGGRDRTGLAAKMDVQIAAVRAALESEPDAEGAPLHPTLCFVNSDWALLARPFPVNSVTVTYPGALRNHTRKKGPLSEERITRIANRLALSLPAAG